MRTTTYLQGSAAALAVALLLGALGGGVARAGVKVDEETKKKLEGQKDDEKAPDSEGNGEGGKTAAPQKNPLPDIIELMRKAEQHLAESETDQWTTDEQQKVIDALEGQQGATEKLKKLIQDLEDQAQSGGGGGQSQKKDKSQGKPGGGQKPQGQKDKDDGKNSLDPNQKKPNQQQKDPKRGDQNQKKTDAQRRTEETPLTPQDSTTQSARTGDKTQGWGNLAPKAQGDAIDAQKRAMPPEFARQLKEYYDRLRETKSH